MALDIKLGWLSTFTSPQFSERAYTLFRRRVLKTGVVAFLLATLTVFVAALAISFFPLFFPLVIALEIFVVIRVFNRFFDTFSWRHKQLVNMLKWAPGDSGDADDNVFLYLVSFPGFVNSRMLGHEPFLSWCRLFHDDLHVSLALSLAQSLPECSAAHVFDVACSAVK